MRRKEMDRLIAHCDAHFRQNDCMVLHPIVDTGPHVDALLYEPNEAYPYWKLVSMGASDYRMPRVANGLGRRNEYVMLIDPDEDMRDPAVAGWYHNTLLTVALYPFYENTYISYGHSIEWGEEDGEEMVSAFLELPQRIENVSFLRCELGLGKTAVMLQIVLLNRAETERLLEQGAERFSGFIYSEDGRSGHFICERKRSERF